LIPGPVSSTHDRAIECFYQLKGGTVGNFHCHTLFIVKEKVNVKVKITI